MPVREQRPRWPVAIVATVAFVAVSALIVYNLIPPTVAVPMVRPLPRAGVVFDSAGTRTGPAPALRGHLEAARRAADWIAHRAA